MIWLSEIFQIIEHVENLHSINKISFSPSLATQALFFLMDSHSSDDCSKCSLQLEKPKKYCFFGFPTDLITLAWQRPFRVENVFPN